MQVIRYTQHCGLVPCLEQPPFAPPHARIVDGHSIRFYDDIDIEMGRHPEAELALAQARKRARKFPGTLYTLALGFMKFCYESWAEEDIVIPVTYPTTPTHAHTHAHTHARTHIRTFD